MYCVNKEEEDSVEAIAGYFKSFGIDEIKVNYKIVVVTHKDIDCPDIIKKLKEVVGDETKIFEVNALNQLDMGNLKTDLCQYLSRATHEHPEMFTGKEVKKGGKKEEKKPKNEGGAKKKKGCVIQ